MFLLTISGRSGSVDGSDNTWVNCNIDFSSSHGNGAYSIDLIVGLDRVLSAPCPVGLVSYQPRVLSASCPVSLVSCRPRVGRLGVLSASCLSALCLSASCLSASCPATG